MAGSYRRAKMMDPDEYDRWAEARDAALARQGKIESGRAAGSESEPARGTHRRPARGWKPSAAAALAESSDGDASESSTSAAPAEGAALSSGAGRVCVDSASLRPAEVLASAAASAPQSSSASPSEHSEPAETLPAAITAAMMAERAAVKFVPGTPAPIKSKMPKIADKATMELVDLAFTAINKLCDKHGKALSKSFGNFDRVVGLGMLVSDALGVPLMDTDKAYKYGIKLRKLPGELKEDQLLIKKAASRAASKLPADDPKRLELRKKADDDLARILRAPIDVELPADEPARTSRRTGSRKSAVPKREDALDARVNAAHAALLAAEKGVTRQQRQLKAAQYRVKVGADRVSRAWRKLRACEKLTKRGYVKVKQQLHWMSVIRKLERKQHITELERSDAGIDYMQAQIEHRDALIEFKDADFEEYQARSAALMDEIEQLVPSAKVMLVWV